MNAAMTWNGLPDICDETRDSPNLSAVLRHGLASAIVVVDDEPRIKAFNTQAQDLFCLELHEVLNSPLDRLPPALQAVIRETLDARQAVHERQIQVPGRGGKVTVCITTFPLLTSGGALSGVVAVLNDISAVQSLEQHMQRYDRLASIGTLSASMAHEIKNALVTVKTFVDLLLKEHQDAELADMAGREMRRIDSIVSQMLRFAGPAKPTFAPVRVHEILDHALRVVQFQLEGKKIALHRSFAASSDWLHGDHYQLEQAFINLFFNAIEAMGQNGALTVATEIIPPDSPRYNSSDGAKAPLLAIRIQDTGTGIPPENIQRLFEPFFTTKAKGTGLGLSITRRIIEEHRGTIAVESELNQGTTFRVAFPLMGKGR